VKQQEQVASADKSTFHPEDPCRSLLGHVHTEVGERKCFATGGTGAETSSVLRQRRRGYFFPNAGGITRILSRCPDFMCTCFLFSHSARQLPYVHSISHARRAQKCKLRLWPDKDLFSHTHSPHGHTRAAPVPLKRQTTTSPCHLFLSQLFPRHSMQLSSVL
jgi:hypothetical protein